MPPKTRENRRPRPVVFQAASDFFFLLNRAYPRKASLRHVGDRYGLMRAERELLHRGVFSQEEAMHRKARRCLGSDWERTWLVVDGHNVHITLESAVLERPLLKGNDGALRDTAGVSGAFGISEVTEAAVEMVLGFFTAYRPKQVLMLFDAPMSRSGELAQRYFRGLRSLGIPGEARAVPVPEREIPYGECTVASSDQAVLNTAIQWMDLACRVLQFKGLLPLLTDFSHLAEARDACRAFPREADPF
ncbi:MAG: DUF434 domain-containing protein [Deltaproteobacteria bacterium]|nr:DUF434 domain-containing protein [Deltaproteobacteria bacterium]